MTYVMDIATGVVNAARVTIRLLRKQASFYMTV
jgi:hypothetical protein